MPVMSTSTLPGLVPADPETGSRALAQALALQQRERQSAHRVAVYYTPSEYQEVVRASVAIGAESYSSAVRALSMTAAREINEAVSAAAEE